MQIKPTEPPVNIDVRTIHAIAQECENEGFGEGAIVTRRRLEKFQCTIPNYWGVVIYLNKYGPKTPDYKPLRIKWFTEGAHKLTETCDMCDLFLIHEAVSQETLELLLDCQNPPWEKEGVPC